MKYKVVSDCYDDKIYDSLEEAVQAIKKEVKEQTMIAYENDQIDKYAKEDIMWDIEDCIRFNMAFQHDDLMCSWDIKECDEDER